jgi:hypothetical protein
MEGIFTSSPLKNRALLQLMAWLGPVFILTSGLFVTSCKKSQPPIVQAPSVEDANQTPAAIPQGSQSSPTPAVVSASPQGGADLKQLNHAYISWILQNKRRPKSFEDFVAMSGIQIPPPPAGKKYVIDKHGFINVENN